MATKRTICTSNMKVDDGVGFFFFLLFVIIILNLFCIIFQTILNTSMIFLLIWFLFTFRIFSFIYFVF